MMMSLSLLISASLPAQNQIRFASVADYGTDANTLAVANLIASWNPDFVITQGDNNYTPNDQSISSWDIEVGQFYGQFIRYPAGSSSAYAPGSVTNRFFPVPGNHDWDAGINGWSNYFDLPGNERYYSFVRGPVEFFAIDSDIREPDGNTGNSTQALWLRDALAVSTAIWKIVYFHHPPFTSAVRGNNAALQWPFDEWGATIVLNGHEHHYERIFRSGFPYIVNGAGGRFLNSFSSPISGSVMRNNSANGAMLITANTDSIVFEYYSVGSGSPVDRYMILAKPSPLLRTTLVPQRSLWKYLDDDSDQGTAWRSPSFNDEQWSEGPARLGFGGDGEVTTINGGPTDNRFITTYFRRAFTVTNPEVVTSLDVDVLRDDGAVIYLNGTEVWRTNMAVGPITKNTLASTSVGIDEEQIFFSISIPPTSLTSGQNVLAVEVHQGSITSSDLGFDLRLVARHNVLVPIQLGSFAATVVSQHVVRLDWMTLSETNNYGFLTQKSQNVHSNYATIPNSFIPGHGTTINPQFYRYNDRTASPGMWYYRLKQIDLDGTTNYSDGIRAEVPTSVQQTLPTELQLSQNYPNPFNPSTSIEYALPKDGRARLAVIDLLGREVDTLVDGDVSAGYHSVEFNGANLAGGIYLYRLNAYGVAGTVFTKVRKLLLLK